jgi:hypothetical protein
MYDRLVTEDEYRQRVRRHRPSSLLPLIAAAAARYGSPQRPQSWLESPSLKYTPWALADAARVWMRQAAGVWGEQPTNLMDSHQWGQPRG